MEHGVLGGGESGGAVVKTVPALVCPAAASCVSLSPLAPAVPADEVDRGR